MNLCVNKVGTEESYTFGNNLNLHLEVSHDNTSFPGLQLYVKGDPTEIISIVDVGKMSTERNSSIT